MANQWRKYQGSHGLITVMISLLTSLVMSVVVLLLFYTHQPAESQVPSALLSQLAGTWKVESISPEPFTVIVSSEGKFTVINPTNPKEAVEIVKLTRLSDSTKVPEGITVQTMATQLSQNVYSARQAEARVYIGSMNRAQQAYFLENSKWSDSIEALGIGINPETPNYRSRTEVVKSIQTIDNEILQVQKIPPSPGIAVQTAIAKKENLKSYVGVVYLSTTVNPQSSNQPTEITPYAILCQSNKPTMKAPGLPKFDGIRMQCPDGYNDDW